MIMSRCQKEDREGLVRLPNRDKRLAANCVNVLIDDSVTHQLLLLYVPPHFEAQSPELFSPLQSFSRAV